jgi:hypothetical protein
VDGHGDEDAQVGERGESIGMKLADLEARMRLGEYFHALRVLDGM